MTILEASKAYESLKSVMKLRDLTGGTVLKLVRLSRVLKDAHETICNRQDQILAEYADHDENGGIILHSDGSIMVLDKTKRQEARGKLDALYKEHFEMEQVAKLTVSLPDAAMPVSAEDVVNLAPFIDFGGGYGD